MIDITIKQSQNKEAALNLARKLPEYFTMDGLKSLAEDLETHEIYGAFSREELIGFISLRRTDTAAIEISWLAVLPNYHRQGIGSRLVLEALKNYAVKGFTICYVKTLAETADDSGYDKTRAFYKKLGFQTLEIISPYPGWTKENPCQILAAPITVE